MPFLRITPDRIPPAFANLGDGEALNKAAALGVSIFQVASIADVRHPGAAPGYDLAYTPGPSADFDPCNYRGPYAGAAQAARAALTELDAVAGVSPTLVAASDLRPGDACDVQGMPRFSAEGYPGAEFELETVESVEPETADCVAIHFESAPSMGCEPGLKFWTRRALWEGARVQAEDGRFGDVQAFRTFTQDGERVTLADVWFGDGESVESVNVWELENVARADALDRIGAELKAEVAAGRGAEPVGPEPLIYGPDLQATDAARAATGVDSISAGALLETGVVLVRRALAAWASGDLAAAINGLEEWAGDVESNFPALDYDDGDESDVEADEPATRWVTFIGQAWIADHAHEVDEGRARYAVTESEYQRAGGDGAREYDALKDAKAAPAWVKNWGGPFEVEPDEADGADLPPGDSRADVLAAALDYLAAIGEPAPNPTPWTVTDDEARPIAVLGRFATEDEGAAFIDTLDGAQRERGGFGLEGPADD